MTLAKLIEFQETFDQFDLMVAEAISEQLENAHDPT